MLGTRKVPACAHHAAQQRLPVHARTACTAAPTLHALEVRRVAAHALDDAGRGAAEMATAVTHDSMGDSDTIAAIVTGADSLSESS